MLNYISHHSYHRSSLYDNSSRGATIVMLVYLFVKLT